MITQNFVERRPQANYVLYSGRLRKPGDGDLLTENHSSLWGTGDHVTASDESADVELYMVGDYSLKAAVLADATPDGRLYYPSAQNAGWTMNTWGGKNNIPTLDFWVKTDAMPAVGEDRYLFRPRTLRARSVRRFPRISRCFDARS